MGLNFVSQWESEATKTALLNAIHRSRRRGVEPATRSRCRKDSCKIRDQAALGMDDSAAVFGLPNCLRQQIRPKVRRSRPA